MRDQRAIENEMNAARVDLEASLGELKDVIEDKLDIKKHAKERAHELVDRGKHEASDLVDRAKGQVTDVYERARHFVRERPGAVLLVVTGLFAVSAIAVVAGFQLRESRRYHGDTVDWLRKELSRISARTAV